MATVAVENLLVNNDEEECNSSVDTNEAFMEMLGFSNELPTSLDVADHIEELPKTIACTASNSVSSLKKEPMHFSTIDLPARCSRHLLDPSSCLALVLDDVFTEEQCQDLILMASNGFRYITEATHKAPDGSTYTIQIQNPNEHKLSAIDTQHDPQRQHPPSARKPNLNDPATSLMDQLYSTISASLPSHASFQSFSKRTKCGAILGLNPRLRVLQYDAKDNDRFEAHFDATTFVPGIKNRRKSLITVLVYLNNGGGDEFEGGETLYLDFHNSTSAKPNYDGAIKVVPRAGRVVLFEHDLFHSGAPLVRGTKYIMRTDILFDENGSEEEEVMNTSIFVHEEETIGSVLVSDMCIELKLSEVEMSILNEMDLLDITCESLLSPGITLLKKMLLSGGINGEIADSLVKKATAAVNVKK